MKIPIEKIIVSEDNPRLRFDEDKLRKLGESIETHGQIQPIVVRQKGGVYELVVGERRFRACALVDMETIDAEVRDIDDVTAMELRLIENVHREDLTDAEKGDAVYSLIENYEKYKSIKDVSDAIDVSYNTVLRDWCPKSRKLSKKVKELIDINQLTEEHSRIVMRYSHTIQNKLVKTMIKHKIPSHKAREFCKLYDIDPKRDLDEIANEILGIKKVTISESDLTDKQKDKIKEDKETKKSKQKEPLPDEQRCIGITGSGTRCKNKRLPDKEYCGMHDPEKEKKPKAKTKKKSFRYKKIETKQDKVKRKSLATNSLNELTSTEWVKFTRTWYVADAIKSDLDEKKSVHPDADSHPASFCPTMIADYIRFFTKKDDVVLDPFNGIGTTLVSCSRAGRKGIGIDIRKSYCEIANEWVKSDPRQKVICGDAWKIDDYELPKVNYTITSPPYYNMLKKIDVVQKERIEKGLDTDYGDAVSYPETVEEYIDKLVTLFEKISLLTVEGGYCTIILQNYREKERVIPLAWELALKMREKWIFKGERIWCQSSKTLRPYGYPSDWVPNVHHHYCLIFKKRGLNK